MSSTHLTQISFTRDPPSGYTCVGIWLYKLHYTSSPPFCSSRISVSPRACLQEFPTPTLPLLLGEFCLLAWILSPSSSFSMPSCPAHLYSFLSSTGLQKCILQETLQVPFFFSQNPQYVTEKNRRKRKRRRSQPNKIKLKMRN